MDIRINTPRLVALFQELVAIDSPSFGERAMADVLTAKLKELGFSVEEDDAAEKLGGTAGNLIASLPGSLELPPILLCCHMDTVAPAFGKRAVVDPDGKIRSGGDTVLGADDLAAVAEILEAVRALREQGIPHRPVELLVSAAEEPYCRGASVLDCSRFRAREAYVLDYDGPIGSAAIAAPTIVDFEICVEGKSAHAGFAPEQGVSAIVAAAKAMARFPGGRISGTATLNYGKIEGGRATNIVPDRCVIRGEIRSAEDAFAFELLDRLERTFREACGPLGAGVTVTHRCLIHAYDTPEDAPVVRRYKRVCSRLGFPVELVRTFGGSDNNCLAYGGIQGIVMACAMHGCHTCGEYTTVRELTDAARITAALLTDEE